MPVIETTGLRKSFGSTLAVDSLSLTVEPGEVFGFLGPNGAGKTTTIKMLLGLVFPSAGRALVLNSPPGDPAATGRIGFLPEHFRFPPWLNASEFLEFHARLYKMPAERRRRRVPEMLDLVGLAGRERTRLGEFSKGMAQRIGLAQALLNEPELVILDEPTSGLDPLGRRHVMEIIRGLRRDGVTVFLNSHLLSEVEATCDRVAVMKKGRMARSGTLNELAGPRLEIEIRVEGLRREMAELLAGRGDILRREGDRFLLAVEDPGLVPELVAAMAADGARIHEVTPRRLPLEELFVRIIEEA